MKGKIQFMVCVIVGLALMALALAVMPTQPLVPAEAGFPTPQCCAYGVRDWVMVDYIAAGAASGITQTTCGSGYQTGLYALADIRYTVDISTVVPITPTQWVTCSLNFSNDGTNWCSGIDVTANMTVDVASECNEIHLFGRYSRVCCSMGAADNPVTVTVSAKVFD